MKNITYWKIPDAKRIENRLMQETKKNHPMITTLFFLDSIPIWKCFFCHRRWSILVIAKENWCISSNTIFTNPSFNREDEKSVCKQNAAILHENKSMGSDFHSIYSVNLMLFACCSIKKKNKCSSLFYFFL